MYNILKTTAVALAASVSANPGIGGSISQAGFNNAKNIALPIVFQKLQNITVPELDVSPAKFTNLFAQLPQPALKDVNIILNHAGNGIEIKVSNAGVHATSDFSIHEFITFNGKADITVKDVIVDIEVGLSTQAGTPSSTKAPKLTVIKSTILINPDNVDIKLSGGAVADIASIIIPLIKSSLIPVVVKQVNGLIKKEIETTINADLAKYGSQITIPYLAGVTLDYGQLAGPQISSDSVFSMDLNGTFFNAGKVESNKFSPAAFGDHNAAGKSLQGYITDYVFNTMFAAGFNTGNTLDVTGLLNKFFNITVMTEDMAVLIPQFMDQYENGTLVQIEGTFTKNASSANFNVTGVEFTINIGATIKVAGKTVLYAEFDAASVKALFSSKSGKIFGNVSEYTLGSISDFTTTLTNVTSAAVLKEVSGKIGTNLELFNKQLAAGVLIPTILGAKADIELACGNGWVEFGLDATPEFFQVVQDMWVAYKVEYDNINLFEINREFDEVKNYMDEMLFLN